MRVHSLYPQAWSTGLWRQVSGIMHGRKTQRQHTHESCASPEKFTGCLHGCCHSPAESGKLLSSSCTSRSTDVKLVLIFFTVGIDMVLSTRPTLQDANLYQTTATPPSTERFKRLIDWGKSIKVLCLIIIGLHNCMCKLRAYDSCQRLGKQA